MISFSTLKKALVPQIIETSGELQKVIGAKHEPVRIFGISFNPKYIIKRDVFDKARREMPSRGPLKLPENFNLLLIGLLPQHMKVEVPHNSSFVAKLPNPPDIYEGILGGRLET